MMRRPTGESGPGYVVERLDWYRCIVPEGVVPQNQDGEVAQFALLSCDELRARLARDEFTVEAAMLLACSAESSYTALASGLSARP
jgi:hypothetical protein